MATFLCLEVFAVKTTHLVLACLLLTLPDMVMADEHNGAWWKAEGTGCLVWNHDPQPQVTVTWTGDCVGGKAGGYGKKVWRYLDEDGAMV